MVMEVSHYGVHWAPGRIAFLQQQRGGTNAVGLRETSPFVVRIRKRWLCNHLIPPNNFNPARVHMERFHEILERNSLARFLLPMPGRGVGVYHSKSLGHVALLLKMSSPIRLPVLYASLTNPRTVMDELEVTNVQPLVLAGVEVKHISWVSDIIQAAPTMPRSLLVLSASDVPLRASVLEAAHMLAQDDIDLVTLPWESLGALTVRAYMRDEWLPGNWFLREPIPGNEPKRVNS